MAWKINAMKKFDLKVFAERLEELREEKNLTIVELGKEIGVSAMAISRWEREMRMPNIESLFLVAKFFKVSADYLCGLED